MSLGRGCRGRLRLFLLWCLRRGFLRLRHHRRSYRLRLRRFRWGRCGQSWWQPRRLIRWSGRLLLLLLLLLLLCLLLWLLGLLLVLRNLRSLGGFVAGVKVATAEVHVSLGGRGIVHRFILGSMILLFSLGPIPRPGQIGPQRCSLWSGRKVRPRRTASQTIGSDQRRCRRRWCGRG